MENNDASGPLNCQKSNLLRNPRRVPLKSIANITKESHEGFSRSKMNKRNKINKVSLKVIL